MEKRRPISTVLTTIIVLLLMVPVLFAVLLVSLASSVSGTATLPGGLVATIDGPFSVSENIGRTTIEANGRQFVFTPAAIVVDGANVAGVDDSVLQVAIDARGYDAELSVNGKRVSLPPR